MYSLPENIYNKKYYADFNENKYIAPPETINFHDEDALYLIN